MAKLSRRRVAREIVRLLNEQPNRRIDLMRQVAAYLLQTKQANQAHLLLDDIADELLLTQGSLSAEVRSAFNLSATTREQIVALLQRKTGAKTVELSETIDPSLIGGVVVRTPDALWDASVKRQLSQLVGGM